MKSWEQHWDNYPRKFKDHQLLEQVGKTVGGEPVSVESVDLISHAVLSALEIRPEDRILDLCCGNGLITKRIAEHCEAIFGIDYSLPLIEVAKKLSTSGNTRFYQGSVLDFECVKKAGAAPISKIYMYEALQHFSEEEFKNLLTNMARWNVSGRRIFFGSVPDVNLIDAFYDSAERKRNYEKRIKKEGRDALGTWWDRDTLADITSEAGYEATFQKQNSKLYTAHYRFDVVLKR